MNHSILDLDTNPISQFRGDTPMSVESLQRASPIRDTLRCHVELNDRCGQMLAPIIAGQKQYRQRHSIDRRLPAAGAP